MRVSKLSSRDLVSFVLLIVLVVLLAACSLFAAESKFADVPAVMVQPGTNVADASPATPSVPQSNTVPSDAQERTNVLSGTVTNGMDTLDEIHKLAIGDHISFRIVEDEEDPKQLSVTDSGELEVPYLGRFSAVGKSCKELARALKAELEKEYYYQATVIVAVDLMTKSRGKVYLVGAVRAAGPQDIPSDEILTLSKAILRAGSFSDFGDKHHVKVTRKGGLSGNEDKTFIVNVAEILEKGKTDFDLALEPGDFIYIPERSIRF
jgi:polysaccharide export outer membrane protein